MLIDSFGRTLDYLRVSVTDRCNLRCVYCMPPEGVEWKPHDTMLTFEEILRVCKIMADLGIRKIRVTGGEPLVRRGTASFIVKLKAVPGIEKVTLTSNATLLGAFLDETEVLIRALPEFPAAGEGGLSFPDGVNISLDALDGERFRRITRNEGPGPEDILPLVDRLLEKRIQVKLNCVPIRGFNEEEIIPLAALAKNMDISVRFIELMPLGCAAGLEPITGAETAALLEKAFGGLEPFDGLRGNGPAVYYSLRGFTGKIGFINPVSRGFCETCNRLRLTSEGILKTCLSANVDLDLRALLRGGASDSELSRAITETAAKKPRFHTLSPVYGPAPAEGQHAAGMSGIGG